MLKSYLMRFKQKKDSVCARPGCNNQIKREKNGTEFNYCSSSCQTNHYSPGSSEFYDEFLDSPSYTSTSSNQWGVWSPNQEDSPPSYSSHNNDNDLFGSIDNVQVTPLWEAEDDPPLNTSNSRKSRNSRRSSSPKLEDDFPLWVDSQVDPLWTPSSNRNTSNRNPSNRNPSNRNTSNRNTSNRNTTSRKFSPPATPRSNSPSDEEEIHCPQCTFFIRPNKTSCEMCGTSITRQEPKRSHNKSSSKPKSTITSYRDLYEEDENEDEEVEEDEDEDPFADPTPGRNNRSSYSSRDNYRNSSSSKSRNSDNYDDYNFDNYEYSQPRNQSSSRNRRSSDNRSSLYQSPTPPSDELWVDEDENYYESIPSRRSTRQRPPPKPYATPSFFKETESRSNRNVQKPPTPPLKEKQISCPACNFDNHLSMTHCEICYTQLNKTPEQDSKKNSNFNRIETRAKKTCPTCSYYNDANSVQCEMCYRPMETIRKSIFSLPSFFSHDVNMTQCPGCTFMNHHTMAQCEMCQGELPGSNLKQQQQQYQQIVDNMPGPLTKLIKLPVDDHDYMTVQQHFKTGVPNANVFAIFRVIMPERIIKAHDAYQKQLAGNNPVANVTHRMYHGSHVSCDAKRYYGTSAWNYCNAADCGLCGIAQNGNSCARSKYNGRMWFASSSATSLGYCRNDPIKAMFVQEIISQTGGDVIIVDKEAATLVKFLIIFQ